MSQDPEASSEDAGEAAFEAELRAEVQADLDQRLAEADAGAPEPDPGPELELEVSADDPERGVWDDPDGDWDPDDPGPVVMRPFPGMGGHNPIVGGGNLIAAFEEEVDPSAGYLVGELPGEELFKIEGPRAGGGAHCGHLLVLGLCLSPLLAIVLGVEEFFPPREYERLVTYTVFGMIFVGLGLGLFFVIRAGYEGGRAVCTSEGIGVESNASAAWIPWDEVWGYEHEDEVVILDTEQGTVSFSATSEEAGSLIQLLDERGIERGRVSTAPPQPTEGGSPPLGGGGSETL